MTERRTKLRVLSYKCVETLHQQPKSQDMVKTKSSPQRGIGYGDIEWEENPVLATAYQFESGVGYHMSVWWNRQTRKI